MATMMLITAALAAAAPQASSTGPGVATAPAPAADAEAAQVAAAADLIKACRPAEALAALDGLLANAGETRLIFCARSEAEPMLARAPMNADLRNELCEFYKARKDWARAAEQFKQADIAAAFAPHVVKSAEQRRAWRGQAYVLTERGKLDAAAALYRKCLAMDASDAGARAELDHLAGLRRGARPDAE